MSLEDRMRLLLLTSEPPDVARASGTAVALARLRSALADAGISAPILRPQAAIGGGTLARWRFNRALAERTVFGVDAVIGVNGDGWALAERLSVPFVALVKALYAGAAAYERGPTRVVLGAHARWERRGVLGAARVIVPSHFAAQAVARAYGAETRRVRVVPEPFDADEWRRALPQVTRQGNRVLCVAHLYPRKRVADLLAAWPRVRARRPDVRLDIAGGGPELRRLVHQARDLDACYLHGHVSPHDLVQLYARADVFCLPSGQETFGYAAVEAMASGLPLVIADSGALSEVSAGSVRNVVAEGDVAALSSAILEALTPAQREQARAVNPERAAAFSPERILPRFIDAVLGSTVGAQRRAGGSVARSEASAT